ncbi:curli-like amyloid fiber formation chaperone CsgH [Jiella sp. M17.18]|uniref:curli-like amyloid fiber formation chaperone CsgH n=1 Tax=Jiella sp. M17.18 TaxID=3234247 RepID=UPI0034DF2B38
MNMLRLSRLASGAAFSVAAGLAAVPQARAAPGDPACFVTPIRTGAVLWLKAMATGPAGLRVHYRFDVTSRGGGTSSLTREGDIALSGKLMTLARVEAGSGGMAGTAAALTLTGPGGRVLCRAK